MLTQKQIDIFRSKIWNFYFTHKRSFLWRNNVNAYQVFISEVMLQQTQTYRVVPKYEQFLSVFPDFSTLASAQLRDVLGVWQGLGYNRRAKFLHHAAQKVALDFNNRLPDCPEQLVTLPGIGPATAASIVAFAYNKPTVFIETNIRTVFIHTFFSKEILDVHDNMLLPLIAQTVDIKNPREWYYALMDYGVYLKKTEPNPSRRSKHHTKQSKFEGSDRQIRGKIIKLLVEVQKLEKKKLISCINDIEGRTERIIKSLIQEDVLFEKDGYVSIR